MRILITGSRTWEDETLILYGLGWAWATLYKDATSSQITLVSGACPNGADALCEQLASTWGWTIEKHPADWAAYGKRAGFVRNSEMVALGADVCLAFIKNNSKGATMTADLAEKAGLQTVRFLVNDVPKG